MEFEKGQHHANGEIPEFGAIFMSSSATKRECLVWGIFGLPSSLASFVEQVKVGMLLFLFDFEKRQLHGVFRACSDGSMNIVPHAFSSSGRTFPAQVKFTLLWHCAPLSEKEFRQVIQDNYFTAKKFNFGLSEEQVHGLLYLFSRKRIKVPIPKKPLHGRLIYANGAKDEHYPYYRQRSNNDATGASDNFGKVETLPDCERFSPSERIHNNHKGKTRVGSSSCNWRLWDASNKLNLNGETEDCGGSHGIQNENRPVDSLGNVGRSAELRIAPDSGKGLLVRLKENRDNSGACWPNTNHYNRDASIYLMKTNLGACIHRNQSQPVLFSTLSHSNELPQYIPCPTSTEDSYLNSTCCNYPKASSMKYGNCSPFQGYRSSKEMHHLQKQKQPPLHPVDAEIANGILKSSSLLQNQVPPRTISDHENLLSTTDEQFLRPAFHENATFQPCATEVFGGPSFSSPMPVDQIPSPHILSHRKNLQANHMYDDAVQDTCLHSIQYGQENMAYGSTLLEDSSDHLLQDERNLAAWSAAGYQRCAVFGYDEECFQYSETMNSLFPKKDSVFTRLTLPSETRLQEKDFTSIEDDIDASPDEIMSMLQLCCHRSQWPKGNKSSIHIKNKHHDKRAPSTSIKSKKGDTKASPDNMGIGSIEVGDHQVVDGPFLNFKRRSETRKTQIHINAEDTHETLSSKDGRMIEEERPFLDSKSWSQVPNAQIQSNAEGCNVTLISESPSVAQVKRRKLIRPNFSSDKKGTPDEGCIETLISESPSVSQVKKRRLTRSNFSFDRKGALEEDFNETSPSVSPSVAQTKRKKLIRPDLSSGKKEAADEKAICACDSQPCELKSHDCLFKTKGDNNEMLHLSQNTCNLSRPGDNDKPGPNISVEKTSSTRVDLYVVGDGSLTEPLQDFQVKASLPKFLCKDEIGGSEDTTRSSNLTDGSGKESSLFSGQPTSPLLLLNENKSANSDETKSCKDIGPVGSGEKSCMLKGQPAMLDSSPGKCGDGKSGQMVRQRINSPGQSPAELMFIPLGDPVQSETLYVGVDDFSSKSDHFSNFESVSKEKECELSLCLERPLSLDTLPRKKTTLLETPKCSL